MSFFCSNVIGRRINTCSTLISVDFVAACSLSHYFVAEKSAKHRGDANNLNGWLLQADRVSAKKTGRLAKTLAKWSRSTKWCKQVLPAVEFGFDLLFNLIKRECFFRFNDALQHVKQRLSSMSNIKWSPKVPAFQLDPQHITKRPACQSV